MRGSSSCEVGAAERPAYLAGLRERYGEGLATAAALEAAHQRRWEHARHRLLERWRFPAPVDAAVGRLLVSLTQRCTFRCPHCWAFADPAARATLGLTELDAIHRNTGQAGATWTLSGGEPFALPHLAEALRRYPIDCVYTNGAWGLPDGVRRVRLRELAHALSENPHPAARSVTFIISFDSFHEAGSPPGFPLATAVARAVAGLLQDVPGARVRLSHAHRQMGDVGYEQVFAQLEAAGHRVVRTDHRECNGDIETVHWRVGREGQPPQEVPVDSYPAAPVCRAIVTGTGTRPRLAEPERPRTPAASARLARHRFTLGADGGIGLYQILHAPPVPYWLGDPVKEPWDTIAARAARDPLAIALREQGAGPILEALSRFDAELGHALSSSALGVQELMYLILLDPERRLLLTMDLLRGLVRSGRARCLELGTQDRVDAALDAPAGVARQEALRRLLDLT
jgi:hypothetical protein